MTTPSHSLPTMYAPPKLRSLATRDRLEHWYDFTLSAKANSVPSSPPSVRARSSAKKTVRMPTPPSKLEAEFALQLRAHGVTASMREFRFHPTRKWRFDFAWPDQKVAVELHGATYSNGRHNRGTGMKNDADKTNAAQLLGWITLTFTSDHLKDGTAMQHVKEALGVKP